MTYNVFDGTLNPTLPPTCSCSEHCRTRGNKACSQGRAVASGSVETGAGRPGGESEGGRGDGGETETAAECRPTEAGSNCATSPQQIR